MSFDLNLVIYLLGLAAAAGTVVTRIGALERKVERLSGIAARACVLEDWREGCERRLAALERKV